MYLNSMETDSMCAPRIHQGLKTRMKEGDLSLYSRRCNRLRVQSKSFKYGSNLTQNPPSSSVFLKEREIKCGIEKMR